MVSIDDLKYLVLYKKQFYLPVDLKDKSHGSAIMLMTPNYKSSMLAMTSPYTVNKRYFMSYYIEKAIMRYIQNESQVIPIEDKGEYIFEQSLTTEERNELPDSEFGIPSLRKYPLTDEYHVLSAIRFFNYVEEKYEKELASNIIKRIKKFNMKDKVHVGENNRFKPYWEKSGLSSVHESMYTTTSDLKNLKVSSFSTNTLPDLDMKFTKVNNIKYAGYKNDIKAVDKYIDKNAINVCFDRMNKPRPSEVILICVSDINVPESFDETHLTVYTPDAFSKFNYKFSYTKYINYILQLYAVYTLKPKKGYKNGGSKVYDTLAEPAAIVLSNIATNEIKNSPDNQFQMEKIFTYIIEQYGIDTFIETIASNDIQSIMKYGSQLGMKRASDKAFYEYCSLIDEEAEVANNSNTPGSLEKLKRSATSIKRKVRSASVYKLNRIKRDVEKASTTKSEAPSPISESMRISRFNTLTSNDYLREGNFVYLFEDSNKYDAQLRKALFKDRFRSDREVLKVYSAVKADLPFIRFTYTKLPRYKNRNLFIDMCYYNESFFRNVQNLNSEDKKNNVRIFKMYMELLERLLKDENFTGYKKKTIFIPVLDWHHNNSTRMWMYKEDINPIAAIYHMIKFDRQALARIFGDKDVVFLGAKNYFKVNFSKVDFNQGTNTTKFLTLIKRIITLGYNSPADPDPDDSFENSPKGIAMSIVDKVETSKNIDINDVSKFSELPTDSNIFNNSQKDAINSPGKTAIAVKKNIVDNYDSSEVKDNVIGLEKGKSFENSTRGKNITRKVIEKSKDVNKAVSDKDIGVDNSKPVNTVDEKSKKDKIVDAIAKAASTSMDDGEALEKLDTEEFKDMIDDIENDSVNNVRIDASKASKVIATQNEFYKKQVNNKSVEELLKTNITTEIKETSLPIASINEEWKHMTFMNFDKDYDLDSDIIKMLDSMQQWTYPIAVKNIDVRDNSTQDDYLDLWSIECLDAFNTKFTLRVDIPKFINNSNFLKLRGNEKAIMIQSALLPVIKTGENECQIIGTGGYNKIFVRKFGARKGQSMPASSKLIRALNKYSKTKNNIEIEFGNNGKICSKYNLPIDYIDISKMYNKIKTKDYTFYFNQDELRKEYEVDDNLGVPIGITTQLGEDNNYYKSVIYFDGKTNPYISSLIANILCKVDEDFNKIYSGILVAGNKFTYSKASILDTDIPVVIICSYLEGLIATMKKAGVEYRFEQKLDPSIRRSDDTDFITFKDGYLVYKVTYASSMLMNGLKECDTESYSLKDINSRKTYLNFLDNFGGSLKSDGIENSYDCMIDPITKEILEKFKLPSDYVSLLCYASNILCDNKYVKHIDQSGRRWRRKEVIAGYFYKALTSAYQEYANNNRRNRRSVKMTMKQSAIIDLMISKDPSTSDLSINNALNDIECANTVTNKGLVGMNVARGYTISTRGYDDTMINLYGMDTGFSGNVGINRQATVNANIEGGRGFVKISDSKDLSTASSLTMTEAMTPFGVTHDDPNRTLMTFVQTSKHMVRCYHNDPMLVTTGADEALPYMCSDIFAWKAKKNGKVVELVEEGFGKQNYMVVEYEDGKHEYIDLSEVVKKNSDGGYYVPLKLDTELKLGDSFKEGEILAYDKFSFSNKVGESKNLAATAGTLAKCAIINTDESFEDSAIITETFADKLSTDVIMDVTSNVDKGSNIFVYKNIGDHVMEGDTLFATQEDFEDDVVNSLLKNLTIDMDQLSELGRNPVKTKYTGEIKDIKIYRTCELEDMSESLRKFVTSIENKIKKTKKVYNKYNLDTAILPPTNKVPEIGKTKNLNDGVMIIYYINHEDKMGIGSKCTFYSANKGVVKSVISKDKEPYTDFRPNEHIDSFMSLSSISGRMTCSITLFAAVSKLMVELDRSVKDLAGIPYDDSKV